MIDNFSLLSPEEQRQFAESLVAKLNAGKIFLDNNDIEVYSIDTDEMDGSLIIGIGVNAVINRDANWQCSDYEDASVTPDTSDCDFVNADRKDAEKAFKTLVTEFEGYKLELLDLEIDDCTVEDVYEVYSVKDEDSGIGRYDHFGFIGYDSHPYCEVEGCLETTCSVQAGLIVTAK